MTSKAAVIFAFVAFFCFDASAEDSPGVYAYIIGPTYEAPDALDHTVPKATAMRDLIKKTYPGAHISELIGAGATIDAVRNCLHNEVPNVPQFSLIIIYFVGHGERTRYSSGSRSPLDLLLVGATTKSYYANSITINEIYGAIRALRRTNVVVLIDSCHSGGDNYGIEDSPEDDFQKRGITAFVLCSCATNEVSTNGVFTDVVMDVWQKPGAKCRTPPEFATQVRNELHRKQPYMTVDSPIGKYMASCMSDLGKPSMLIGLRPNRQPKYPIWITFDGRSDPETFDAPNDPIFIRSLPRQTVDVGVTCQNRELPKLKATVDMVKNDMVILDIDVPKDFAVAEPPTSTRTAEAAQRSAEAIAAFGGNAAPAYLDAVREFVKVNPHYNPAELMRKVLNVAPASSEEARLAKIILTKEVLPVTQESLDVAKKIRSLGGAELAAAFDSAWAKQTTQDNPQIATVTASSGTITAYTPGSNYITFRSETSAAPTKFYFSEKTKVADPEGTKVERSTLRPDTSVKATIVKEGDHREITNVTITKPASTYERQTTTTTTTGPHD